MITFETVNSEASLASLACKIERGDLLVVAITPNEDSQPNLVQEMLDQITALAKQHNRALRVLYPAVERGVAVMHDVAVFSPF